RNAIKAFVDRKDVFAVLPTGSGKSLMYQLAPWSTLWSYYVALIGSRYIQLSEEAFFFLVRLNTPHNHSPLERYQTHILTRIMSMTSSSYQGPPFGIESNLRPTDVPARACVRVCNRRRHAPSSRTDILPITLKYVKLSGYIASHHHAPSPCTDILPLTLKYVQLSGCFASRHHAPSPCTDILPITIN